jgi:hypothetical protein
VFTLTNPNYRRATATVSWGAGPDVEDKTFTAGTRDQSPDAPMADAIHWTAKTVAIEECQEARYEAEHGPRPDSEDRWMIEG